MKVCQFQANAVLQKPYPAERLLKLIRETLDGARWAASGSGTLD